MRVLDGGHMYLLDVLDAHVGPATSAPLTFVKRIGDKYPGNNGPAHSGTNCQEVIRALINRVEYVNTQIADKNNDAALYHLRWALHSFEDRAARLHGRKLDISMLPGNLKGIEDLPTCGVCGHVQCYARCVTGSVVSNKTEGGNQVPNNQEAKPSDDEARAARIHQARFERGRMDAQMGEPPTEASSEYQKGYEEGARVLGKSAK